MTERTLIICKPDAAERGLVGEILARIERKQLKLVALELRQLDRATAELPYGDNNSKPFFGELIEFITGRSVVLGVVEGTEAIKVWRTMMGTTNPREAAAGTLRGDLAIEMGENMVHGSDSTESAAREIGIFFPNLSA